MRIPKQTRDLNWLVERPIAHRGLHDKSKGILENTATAFADAITGHYAIECDLQLSVDGEAMVFHDETLDRLTAEKGLLRERTAKQLQNIAITNSTDRMQTLAEMLHQVDGRVPLVIELKSHWDGDTALAAEALKVLAGYKGPYALMSFDPDLVAAVAVLAPETVRGITADRAEDPCYAALPAMLRLRLRNFDHLPDTRPHFVSYYFRDLPFPMIQNLRDAGHPIITWTIRNAEQESHARLWSDQITFEGYSA